jgi:hypothetical protein
LLEAIGPFATHCVRRGLLFETKIKFEYSLQRRTKGFGS